MLHRYKPLILKETNVIVLRYKGRIIRDTLHSVIEFKRQFPKLSMSDYTKGLKEGIDKILSEYNDEKNFYIIRSKKHGFGIQLDWDYDRYDYNEKGPFHGRTATTLGKDETKFYTHNDITIFVEQIKKYGVSRLNEDIIHYDNVPLNEIAYFKLEYPQKIKGISMYDVFMEEGNIYRTFDIIEVD